MLIMSIHIKLEIEDATEQEQERKICILNFHEMNALHTYTRIRKISEKAELQHTHTNIGRHAQKDVVDEWANINERLRRG